MKLEDDLDATVKLLNNKPVDDFLGLSPNEMHNLVFEPYGDKSLVQFRKDIDNNTLDQIPLFRIAEEFLKIIQRDKQIKLTPLGALPKKVITELYDKRFLLDEFIESGITKLWKEENCIAIRSARLTVGLTGLVKKVNNKLTLTKTGIKLLDTENRIEIFKKFFQAFTDKFLWGFNDWYPEQPIGQFGWAFTIYMLDKFDDQPKLVDFYAAKFLKAFPPLITHFQPSYSTPEEQYLRCYGIRAFDRFLLWFGFVTVDKQKKYLEIGTDKFKRTDLIKNVFVIEE